ncbi:flagellum-specific ATP synthase FliI, partial [Chimaeribacter californicus]
MTSLIDDTHYRRVRQFKQMLASYQRNRDLVSVGAYAAGSDPLLDRAIRLYPQMEALLQQGIHEQSDFTASCDHLNTLLPN